MSPGTSRPACCTSDPDLAEGAGVSEPPASWDDLKAAATALKDGGAEYGISLGVKNYQEYLPFFWSNGGTILNDDGTFKFPTVRRRSRR